MNRQMPSSRIFVPILVAPDGGRHILPSRELAAYCGQIDGTRYAPAWVARQHLCQRCLQQYMKLVLGAGDQVDPTP